MTGTPQRTNVCAYWTMCWGGYSVHHCGHRPGVQHGESPPSASGNRKYVTYSTLTQPLTGSLPARTDMGVILSGVGNAKSCSPWARANSALGL